MKITIIVPTGEVRDTEIDDWFINRHGNWEICYVKGLSDKPIGKAHEVEVPEGIDFMIPTWGCTSLTKDSIPLHRPKKKVKKWQWVIGKSCYTSHYMTERTEEEIRRFDPKAEWYHKIDETMVEVDE